MNILVTGANGQLGSELRVLEKKYANCIFFFTGITELDIVDKNAIEDFINKNKINCIINCAAYTAVDKAESEFELANKINHLGVKYLAEIAKNYYCKFIHISTDYVFDGISHKPYIETDVPNPQNVYGKTKLDGELALQKINPGNSIIIRTSWVYSNYSNNFVKTMLRLGKEHKVLNVIDDQIGTPTNAADLALAVLTILPKLKNEQVEIYHYSNQGFCSWYDFAKAIFEFSKIQMDVKPIKTSEYPTLSRRPFYSVLDKENIINSFELKISYWKESLKDCLSQLE